MLKGLLEKIGNRQLSVEKSPRFLFIGGPCVIEDADITYKTAKAILEICENLEIPFVFKSSYDKANRSSIDSFRGVGIKTGLAILYRIRQELGIPVTSDIHSAEEVEEAAKVLDIIQIPAFLSRQTDIIVHSAKTGKIINVKKGQFLSPHDTFHIVEKVRWANPKAKVMLTERGTSFGYNNLIVDFRSMAIMKRFAPVVFDATHSVQSPGGKGHQSGGDREFVPMLVRAAMACKPYGLFMEVHPEPEKALSDNFTQFPLHRLERLLTEAKAIFETAMQLPDWTDI